MKTKQDTTRQETVRADEVVAAQGAVTTVEPADVVANDEFAGHGGSYVFDAATGLRTRADADVGAAVEGVQ